MDIVDCWARKDSPNAKAYRLLEGLDLGASLSGADAVGKVEFIDCFVLANNLGEGLNTEPPAQVPEPSTLPLVLAAATLARRYLRSRRPGENVGS